MKTGIEEENTVFKKTLIDSNVMDVEGCKVVEFKGCEGGEMMDPVVDRVVDGGPPKIPAPKIPAERENGFEVDLFKKASSAREEYINSADLIGTTQK